MQTRYVRSVSLISLVSAVLLIGAGCPTTAPPTNLPTTPPAREQMSDTNTNAAMDDTKTDGAMMKETETPDAMMEKKEESTMGDQAANTTAPAYYIAYSKTEYDRALAEHRPIALYFWASWCPICKAEEPGVQSTIEESGLPVSGFRVNYDTETALKDQFRIPYQHTLVILDRNGNESARFTGPVSADVLTNALRQAAK